MSQCTVPALHADFSSAAMALRQGPPARTARMVSLAICVMALAAVAFASLASMDIVVSAQGRVIASGRSKVIQPLEPGVVKAIGVRDGQPVRAGDVLVELDSTAAVADRDRLQRDLWEAQADVLRLGSLLSGEPAWTRAGELPAGIVASQDAILASRRSEQASRMAALDAVIARRGADHEAIAVNLAQLRASLPLVRRKHDMREELARTGYLAETGVIDARLELLNLEKEIAVAAKRLDEAAAGLKAAVQQQRQAQAEFTARVSAERTEALHRQESAAQELRKAQQRADLQTLRSPIDGVVQQLAVSTVGGVVTAAQPLMTIVPHDAPLEVEAQVLNRDIGHVKVGQRVINKLESFDFTRFGYVEGTVQWVGTDAIVDPHLGPVYPVRIALAAPATPQVVNGVKGTLAAGMSVTSDIRSGERRLIEYFVAPLLRHRQEALRER